MRKEEFIKLITSQTEVKTTSDDVINKIYKKHPRNKSKTSLFDKFKLVFRRNYKFINAFVLCLFSSILIISQVIKSNLVFNKVVYEYDTYQQMVNAEKEFQRLYPEHDKLIFDIKLDEVIDYKYKISGIEEGREGNTTFYKRELILILYFELNSYLYVTFCNNFNTVNTIKWNKNKMRNILQINQEKICYITFFSSSNDQIELVKSYIENQIYTMEGIKWAY